MGYNFDFVFEAGEENNYRKIVERFWQAGARIFPDDDALPKGTISFANSKDAVSAGYSEIDDSANIIYLDQLEDKVGIHDCQDALDRFHKSSKSVVMYHPEFPSIGLFHVFKDESETLKGYWALIRISWETKPDEVSVIMKDALELGKRVNCKVYDGQLDRYITSDNYTNLTGLVWEKIRNASITVESVVDITERILFGKPGHA